MQFCEKIFSWSTSKWNLKAAVTMKYSAPIIAFMSLPLRKFK